MRVAILTRDYPPAIGGIATHVEGLVNALRRTGVEADLYVGSNDVKTLLLPFDIPLKRYDVVHVQSLPYGAFVVGVPLVVTVHSPVLEEFEHYRNALKVVSIPAIAFEKVSLRRASAVLAVSGQSRSDLLGRYGLDPGRVEVIGNGVDYKRFSARRDAASPASMKRVLVVSRLEPRKNVKEAIEAVAELPKGACYLDIAGDGSERAALAELAKTLAPEGGVHFLGRVGVGSLPELYGDSAIFLTTSSSEGFGLSLLEAMSCLVKDTLVTTSTGPVPIQNIQAGTLVLTHTGSFRPVLRRYRGMRGGKMYAIETTHGRLCVTATHRLLTRGGWSSADHLSFSFESDRGGEGLHRWLLRWGKSHDHMHSPAEPCRQEHWSRPRDPTNNSGGPERQARRSPLLDSRETRRAHPPGSSSTQFSVDDSRKARDTTDIGNTVAPIEMQEGRGIAAFGSVQQEFVICPEYAGRLDLVHRQSNSSANDQFSLQSETSSKDTRQAEWVEIRSIEPIQYFGEIFDLSVAADNSYVANGITVHNSGCACIASDLPTHRALIEHGVSGMIYKTRAELVSCLQDLLSSPEKVERLGAAARKVASQHTWEKVAAKVMTAYESAVR